MPKENLWTVGISLRQIMEEVDLSDVFPSGVFPIKIGLRLDLSPSGRPLIVDSNEGKKETPVLFQPPQYPFKIAKDEVAWVPSKVIGIGNVLEKPNRSQAYKDRNNSHRDRAVEDENIWKWSDIAEHIKSAVRLIEEENGIETAERFYIDKLRICKIPEEYTPWKDLTSEEKRDFYEGENKCGIAEFTKANQKQKRMIMSKEAKSKNGLVSAIAPGRSLIPLTLDTVERVYTKPIGGRKAKLKKAYYTEHQAEKYGKLNLKPMEWTRDEYSTETLNDWFEELFSHLCEVAKDRCVLFRPIETDYDVLKKEDDIVTQVEDAS